MYCEYGPGNIRNIIYCIECYGVYIGLSSNWFVGIWGGGYEGVVILGLVVLQQGGDPRLAL